MKYYIFLFILFQLHVAIPISQLKDRFINASNDYKNNNIWWRGLDITNSKPFYPITKIFTKKDLRDNVACFRIPSFVNNDKKLLVFTEARLNNCSDCSQKGIVAKTSIDGGDTWSDWKWIIKPLYTAANPTSIYDTHSKKVILHYATGKTNISGNIDCVPSKDNWQIESYDFGRSWSQPYNLSIFLKQYRGLLPGPGNGIQLSSGRLIIPGHYGTAERQYGIVISYYSDDFGKTWKTSKNGLPYQDEATLAVIENDTIIMNMRNGHNNDSCKCRTTSKSFDNGASWGEINYHPHLKDPICQGTSTYLENTYFFLNPNMYYSRSNLTIHYKKNLKDNWKEKRITDEFSYTGYSGLSNQAIKINNTKYLGLIWTACSLSLPFRVWCSFDDKWELVFSRIPLDLF